MQSVQDAEKVIANHYLFNRQEITPAMNSKKTAARTLFITNFDSAITNTYTEEDIKSELIRKEWNIYKVVITSTKKSIKIIMINREQAEQILEEENTSIGQIKIPRSSKNLEIYIHIPQCWSCGELQAAHEQNACTKPKI